MRHPDPTLEYIRRLFAPESPRTRRARERLEQHAPQIAGISVGAEEGRLLQWLIRSHSIRRVVEIGSLTGYSGFWMAEALPSDGELHLIERDPAHAALIREELQSSVASRQSSAPRIFLHEGAALDILPTLQGEVDMVFIDADKPNYPRYLDWAEQHVRQGGLIVGDNTLLFGHVWAQEPPQGKGTPSKAAWLAMREFNQRLADTTRYDSLLLPTAEGMTIARKR